MSKNYSFAIKNNFENEIVMGAAVLVEDGIVWGQESYGDQSFHHVTLNDDMNESFVTAHEDTEYFSILDTSSETIMGDMNITINNSKIESCDTPVNQLIPLPPEHEVEQLNLTDLDLSDQQVLLYNMEGTDELFGVQMAEDENGVLQKYKFALRHNELGQLEAVPESIQILPMENDDEEVVVPTESKTQKSFENEDSYEEEEENLNVPALKIFVKDTCEGEEILPDISTPMEESDDELQVNEESSFEEEIDIDVKQDILDVDKEDKSAVKDIQMHQQIEQLQENTIDKPSELFLEQPEDVSKNYEEVYISANETEEYEVHDQIMEQEEDNREIFIQNDIFSAMDETEKETLVFTNDESNEVGNLPPTSIFETDTDAESDTEEYQIVDGLQITNDGEIQLANSHLEVEDNDKVGNKMVLQSRLLTTHEFNNVKDASKDVALKKIVITSEENQPDKSTCYYVINHPEKENVQKINNTIRTIPKVNPRSILKSSHAAVEEEKNVTPVVEKIEKRFANSKEVIQARLFHNYIAGTTIIHAPVRQERLPRKQKIKPVKRLDEEIVVEEVVVSSNGFVEPSEIRASPDQPIVCVNLSDSDDDYDPRRLHQGKKKQKKRRLKKEIVISDSDEESEASVIDLTSSSEEEEENDKDEEDASLKSKRSRGRPRKSPNNNVNVEENVPTTRRKRGRPPKFQRAVNDEEENDTNVPNKNKLLRSVSSSKKNEIGCSKCTRTFPSQGSLKTHMQYHNFRESRRQKVHNISKSVFENRYKCDECDSTFKNNALLMRHLSTHYNAECGICKKKFKDKSDLPAHRKMHSKENLFRNTSLVTVSPKKFKPNSERPKQKSLLEKIYKFNCKSCGKVFSMFSLLEAHLKTHLHFACSGCFLTFASKPLLHFHQKVCIKRNTILAEIKKLLHNPKKPTTSPAAANVPLKCDDCGMKFSTRKRMFSHRVRKHNLPLQRTELARTGLRNRKQAITSPTSK